MTLNSEIAKKIRLIAFDVDGVMTDAGVFIGVSGSDVIEIKKFSRQDSIGIKLLMAMGIEVVIVSGRVSEATRLRAEELGIKEVIQDPDARKMQPFQALLDRKGVGLEEVAFVGDDLADVPVMRRVALPVAVGNAVSQVRDLAAYTTSRPGGDGAVREFAEAFLAARGEMQQAVDRYLAEK